MIKVTKRYFCDLCGKEVEPRKRPAGSYPEYEDPLFNLDFEFYVNDELSVCEDCAQKISETIEKLSEVKE